MNKCYFQRWEYSMRNSGVIPSGCSLHTNSIVHHIYIGDIYSKRGDIIPEEYDKVCGDTVICYVEDDLYEIILQDGNVRVPETGLQNMLEMCEITFR